MGNCSSSSGPINNVQRIEIKESDLPNDEDSDDIKFMKVIKIPSGCELFELHLKKQYTEQHLTFWVEVQQFRNLNNPPEIEKVANKLFNTFIKKNSVKEVNLTEVLVSQIKESLATPHKDMFLEAERICLDLIKGNHFFTFLQSSEYKTWRG
mmetsp:Transcript_36862/g.72373  ORF Transcript_36862/g.72373 Transcript_36862/m.72373 type:complete len:152 (+) Transcript_36862:24-479(+)